MASLSLIGVGGVSAADLPVKMRPAPVVPLQFSWTGFYGGIHVGAGWGTTEANDDPNLHGCDPSGNTPKKCPTPGVIVGPGAGSVLTANSSHTTNGMLGGGQIGYNYQMGQWVFGGEIQASAADISGSGSCVAGTANCSSKIGSLVTFAARLGWAADRALFFVKGGAAWAHTKFGMSNAGNLFKSTGPDPTDIALVAGGEVSDDRWGWLFGAGVEYALYNNWSAKLEYNYIDLGSKTYVVNDSPAFDVKQRVHTVTAGVNYHFAPGPWR
jgi:outer membrane immunogenic protein